MWGTMKRLTAYFNGQVQGVGFRYACHLRAKAYKVTGFVKNLPDGRVHLVVEGSEPEVERLLEDIKSQMKIYIAGVESAAGEPTGEYPDFQITY